MLIILLHFSQRVPSSSRYASNRCWAIRFTDLYIPAGRTFVSVHDSTNAPRICPDHFHGGGRPAPSDNRHAHIFQVHKAVGARAILPQLPLSIANKGTDSAFAALDNNACIKQLSASYGGGATRAHLQPPPGALAPGSPRRVGRPGVQLSLLGPQTKRLSCSLRCSTNQK